VNGEQAVFASWVATERQARDRARCCAWSAGARRALERQTTELANVAGARAMQNRCVLLAREPAAFLDYLVCLEAAQRFAPRSRFAKAGLLALLADLPLPSFERAVVERMREIHESIVEDADNG